MDRERELLEARRNMVMDFLAKDGQFVANETARSQASGKHNEFVLSFLSIKRSGVNGKRVESPRITIVWNQIYSSEEACIEDFERVKNEIDQEAVF